MRHQIVQHHIVQHWNRETSNSVISNKATSTLFYWGEGINALPFRVFFKYLQNYSLNWLEIFGVWFSNCLKAVLKKLLKIVELRTTPFLGWRHVGKNPPKKFFLFFNSFSLVVISMLCLLVKTIFFENKR